MPAAEALAGVRPRRQHLQESAAAAFTQQLADGGPEALLVPWLASRAPPSTTKGHGHGVMTKTFLQPSVGGFAARIKQQPEDFRVTELPLAQEALAVTGLPAEHPLAGRASCVAEEPPAKRPKLGTNDEAIASAVHRGSGAAASAPAVSSLSQGRDSSLRGVDLPLPDEALLLSSSPLVLPSCCAMPALRAHGANLMNVLEPDRAGALFAFADAASARLQAQPPAAAAAEQEDGAQAVALGTISKAALREVHHGVKVLFPWLDTHTTARADNDASREISARVDDKFQQLVSVVPFQDACNCVRFARFGADEPHAELGLALGADKERRTRVHRTVCSVYRMLESKTKSSPAGDLIALRHRRAGCESFSERRPK